MRLINPKAPKTDSKIRITINPRSFFVLILMPPNVMIKRGA